jgi:predicted HicB family RNase H-like nuclease
VKTEDLPKRRGRPRKTAEHQLFSLRLPPDLHNRLRHHALDERRSLNDILVEVIEEWWRGASRKPRK